MYVKYLVQGLTFLCAILSSDGLNCLDTCGVTTLHAPLGSVVSLPCTLLKSNSTSKATWSQTSTLLSMGPQGHITFQDPRGGRVTAFPYLFHRGNFSILIRGLQTSDLGTYCCELSLECQRVEIRQDLGGPAGQSEGLDFPWYYVVIGVGFFTILLLTICSLSFIIRRICLKGQPDSNSVNSPHREGDCIKQPQTNLSENKENCRKGGANPGTEADEEDYVNIQKEKGHQDNPTIYENDEHHPNLISRGKTGPHPCPRGYRATPDQQANRKATFYANQSEIQKSSGPGKRRKKEYQLRNPIYDDSTGAHNT
ncbi:uncharacterized protein LOC113584381 [Electrophorus electricus]|uniref:uncharacterized protein LOC113584381 n=1 Tax=Electrophorus electricus TaxID=8005 RepID=UPI0015D047BC|nr:uncharacterized protein LOC113584381 [Electrophorus electricus]